MKQQVLTAEDPGNLTDVQSGGFGRFRSDREAIVVEGGGSADTAGKHRQLSGFFLPGVLTMLLITTALTWPDGSAHAQCVTTGTTVVDCTGSDPAVLDGITDGVDFFAPPVDTINVFDIDGAIRPLLPGVDGIFANTESINNPLTVFVGQGFEIITVTEDASGIRLQTRGADSPIDLTNWAAITTSDVDASGIWLQTRGAGSPIDLINWAAITTSGVEAPGIWLQTQGAGSPVDLTNWAAITTSGEDALGIFAQSLSSDSGITVRNYNTIVTGGAYAYGISLESKGDGMTDMPITLTNEGAVTTTGDEAIGIWVQTQAIRSSVEITNHGAITTSGEEAVGLYGAATNSDSSLTVRNYNTITTTGDSAFGIRLTTGEVTTATSMPIRLANEGAITTSGDAGFGIRAASFQEDSPITIINSGPIKTQGASSVGIYLTAEGKLSASGNSIDLTNSGTITIEGGQYVGLAVLPRASGIFAESSGDGGGIKITNEGEITTLRDDVMGIYASTVGTDAPITIDNWADVIAKGAESSGIRAFTGDASSDVTVNLYGGVVQGGSGEGNGIDLTPPTGLGTGVANTGIVNVFADAAVTTLGANAIRAGDGDDTVNNEGTVTGNVDLGGGTNAFNNMETGLFNAGPIINLGGGLLTNEGTLSPGGEDIVPITVLTGDLHQVSGTFQVDVDGATADRLNVTGEVTVDGGTVVVRGKPVDGREYIILSAGVVLTVNNPLTVEDTVFVDYSLEYDSKNYYLFSTVVADFCDFAGTANQKAVGCNGLDSLPGTNDIVQAVLALTGTEEVQAAYDALSGEVQASLKGALMENAQNTVNTVNERINAGFTAGGLQASTAAFGNLSSLADGNSGFWMTGYGSWSDRDATANTAQMDNDLGGVVFGLDREISQNWRIGVLGGYSRSDVSQNALLSTASADTWSLGLYGGARAGANVLSFGAIHNWHAIDTARTVSFTGVSQGLSASYDAQSWQLFAEAGHTVWLEHVMLQPFAGVSFISLDTDGYTETGGSAALTAASDTQNTTFTTLGVRSSIQVMDTVQARGMLGWRHAFGDVDPSSTFTLAGSDPFTITGAPTAQDALVADLGLEAQLSDNAFLGVSYNGQYGDGTTTHGFNAGFRARF